MTSQRRDSDICLTYSPIPPEGQNDDPESMFSPSRPIKKTFLSQLWAFRRRRSSNYDNIPRTIDSGEVPCLRYAIAILIENRLVFILFEGMHYASES